MNAIKISQKKRRLVAVTSAASALAVLASVYFLNPGFFATFSTEIALTSILIAITPSAVVDFYHSRWVNKIEDQMPILVKGISECQETGLTFMKAFEKVTDNKLVRPPLADEVKKLTVQMLWGLSFEESLKKLKDRVGLPVVTRFCALVLEASRSGGQVRKVFAATSSFMDDMRDVDRETSAQMRPYIIIVYSAFFVLIFTAVILLQNFFGPLQGLNAVLSSSTLTGVTQYKDFFYRTLIVSALFGGLMAGKIGEQRIAAGLKHAIIMLVAGYLIFFILSPPNWAGMV